MKIRNTFSRQNNFIIFKDTHRGRGENQSKNLSK